MKNEKKRKPSGAPTGRPKRRKMHSGDAKEKRPVSVDALAWKTVDVPEMFDDAEGFYGLEVVEGVDIVKDGGAVQFVWFFPLFFFHLSLVDCSHVLDRHGPSSSGGGE